MSVDVTRAFDSVSIPLLLSLVEPLLRHDSYLVLKYSEVCSLSLGLDGHMARRSALASARYRLVLRAGAVALLHLSVAGGMGGAATCSPAHCRHPTGGAQPWSRQGAAPPAGCSGGARGPAGVPRAGDAVGGGAQGEDVHGSGEAAMGAAGQGVSTAGLVGCPMWARSAWQRMPCAGRPCAPPVATCFPVPTCFPVANHSIITAPSLSEPAPTGAVRSGDPSAGAGHAEGAPHRQPGPPAASLVRAGLRHRAGLDAQHAAVQVGAACRRLGGTIAG